MARCAFCKAEEAPFNEYRVPICLNCAELNNGGVQAVLVKALSEATLRRDSANAEFAAIMSAIPSGMPSPDGQQRIHNASAKLTVAQHKMSEAHARLADFLDRGIVPEDLKRSG